MTPCALLFGLLVGIDCHRQWAEINEDGQFWMTHKRASVPCFSVRPIYFGLESPITYHIPIRLADGGCSSLSRDFWTDQDQGAAGWVRYPPPGVPAGLGQAESRC